MSKLIALVLFAVSSHACATSCFIPPLDDRYRDSAHVMLVEVVEARMERSSSYRPHIPGLEPEVIVTGSREREEPIWSRIVATVRVLESYKGEDPPTELTLTETGSPEITVGAMYLVFTDGPDISLGCDGMPRVWQFDPADLKRLGTLRAFKE